MWNPLVFRNSLLVDVAGVDDAATEDRVCDPLALALVGLEIFIG
jgi:hypothetical protein